MPVLMSWRSSPVCKTGAFRLWWFESTHWHYRLVIRNDEQYWDARETCFCQFNLGSSLRKTDWASMYTFRQLNEKLISLLRLAGLWHLPYKQAKPWFESKRGDYYGQVLELARQRCLRSIGPKGRVGSNPSLATNNSLLTGHIGLPVNGFLFESLAC